MTTDSSPTLKVIIQKHIGYRGKEKLEVETANNETTIDRTYLKYTCPKPGCQVGEVEFLDKTGHKKPFSNLKTCYGKGFSPSKQDELIKSVYHDVVKDKETKGGSIRSHFAIHAASSYDRAIYLYLRLIVIKKLPIYYVEDSYVRRFSKHDVTVSRKTIVEVIFSLVTIVEDSLRDEMKKARGPMQVGTLK